MEKYYLASYSRDRQVAYLIYKGNEIEVKLSRYVKEGSFIEGEQNNGFFIVKTEWLPDEKEIKALINETENSINILNINILNKEFDNEIYKMARKIKAAQLLRRQTIIRFHNDADGIISALLISQVLPGQKIPQQSAIYTVRDAFNDIGNISYGNMPFALFLDFGSSNESKEAFEILKSDEVEINVIDHHPLDEEMCQYANILNPSKNGLSSDYTTGYLSNNIILCLGLKPQYDFTISLAGDKSNLPYDENAKSKALALDFAAFYTGSGINVFNIYKEIIKNESLALSIAQRAKEKMDIALKQVLNKAKKFNIKDKINLYYIDALNIELDFPPSGKLATLLAENIDDKSIILSCSKSLCSLRLSKSANISLTALIKRLKEKATFIISGGGHERAASFKIKETERDLIPMLLKDTIEELIDEY